MLAPEIDIYYSTKMNRRKVHRNYSTKPDLKDFEDLNVHKSSAHSKSDFKRRVLDLLLESGLCTRLCCSG
jgi:hypothetical protein